MGRRVIEAKHIDSFTDRHGHTRLYFRRGKGKRIPLPPYGSKGFDEAYAKALAGSRATVKKEGERSINALLRLYFASPKFLGTELSSQTNTRRILERFAKDHGHRLVADLELEHVERIIGRRSETPAAANNLLRKLRALMNYGIKIGWLKTDPTKGADRFKEGSHHTWTEREIALFEKRWALGTRERTAFALALYTGQRRADLAAMEWRQYDPQAGTIEIAQQKTDMAERDEVLVIRVHSELRKALEAWPKQQLRILATDRAMRMSAASFGNFMADAIHAAGLPEQCVLHGLRKAAARRIAEAGGSSKQIAAVTGHKSLEEVERYTKRAEQRHLAGAAIALLEPKGDE